MSAHLLGIAFGARMGTHCRKLILLKLVDHCRDDGTKIFPAMRSLAEAAECDRRTVQKALRDFVRVGLLSVVQQGGRGPGCTTEYAFDLDRLFLLARQGWQALEAGAGAAELDEAAGDPEEGTGEAAEPKGGLTPPLSGDEKGRHGCAIRAASVREKGGLTPPKPLREPLGEPSTRDAGAQAAAREAGGTSRLAAKSAGAQQATERNPERATGHHGKRRGKGKLPIGQQEAGEPKYHVFEAWTRGWWCVQRQAMERGEISRVNLDISLAKQGRPVQLTEGKHRIPTGEEISALMAICATSPEWAKWDAWFRAHGVRFPLWDREVWCWVPAREPPGG